MLKLFMMPRATGGREGIQGQREGWPRVQKPGEGLGRRATTGACRLQVCLTHRFTIC